MNLDTQDYGVILGGVALTFLGAIAAQMGLLSSSLVSALNTWLPRVTILVILAGLAFVYLARDLLGGEMVQNLDVIASGFLIYAVIWWPHKIAYHGPPFGGKGASLFGVFTPTTWNVFFHTLTGVLFAISAFGFYRFWQMSQGVNS